MSSYKIITDATLRETTVHGTNYFPFEYTVDDIQKFNMQCIEWHWHNEFEFVSVSTGPVDCLIGNDRIRIYPGDGIFINSGTIHRFEASNAGTMPNILFSPEFISPKHTVIYDKYINTVIASEYTHITLCQKTEWQNKLLNLLNKIYLEVNLNSQIMELQVKSLVCTLWSELFLSINDSLVPKKNDRNMLLHVRLQLMLQFIHEQYSQKITLKDIAEAANISKSEALRCFGAGVSTTPVDYLIKYRLNRAKDLLLTTKYSVSEIALAVGFNNIGYFNRIFKNDTGMTPKEFRGHHSTL